MSYKVDLNQVPFPKNLPEKALEEAEQSRRSLTEAFMRGDSEHGIQPLSEVEAQKKSLQRFPMTKFVASDEFEDAISGAINNFMQLEHFDKERKIVVAPWDVRKIVGKIQNKVIDSDNGKFELSDEQLDFLVKVLSSDLPASSYYFYLGEYFETLKLEGGKEERKNDTLK